MCWPDNKLTPSPSLRESDAGSREKETKKTRLGAKEERHQHLRSRGHKGWSYAVTARAGLMQRPQGLPECRGRAATVVSTSLRGPTMHRIASSTLRINNKSSLFSTLIYPVEEARGVLL